MLTFSREKGKERENDLRDEKKTWKLCWHFHVKVELTFCFACLHCCFTQERWKKQKEKCFSPVNDILVWRLWVQILHPRIRFASDAFYIHPRIPFSGRYILVFVISKLRKFWYLFLFRDIFRENKLALYVEKTPRLRSFLQLATSPNFQRFPLNNCFILYLG